MNAQEAARILAKENDNVVVVGIIVDVGIPLDEKTERGL